MYALDEAVTDVLGEDDKYYGICKPLAGISYALYERARNQDK